MWVSPTAMALHLAKTLAPVIFIATLSAAGLIFVWWLWS